ncbi:hypothetical protein BX600DRAFT_500295 [Xylariales sp. PMI_506]|nr:hypothetical protein BX600DRAFT_500295 [Xylariales sp. PMI_506]
MHFNVQSAVIFGLVALAQGSPLRGSETTKRSAKGELACPEGTIATYTGAVVGGNYAASACVAVAKRGDKKEDGGNDKKNKKGTTTDDDDDDDNTVDDDDYDDEEDYEDESTTESKRALLDARTKKKSVATVDCNGVSISSEIVGAALSALKKGLDSKSSASYPKEFKNYEGIFATTTATLEEFPVLTSGAIWSTGTEPGKYRVVADSKKNYKGVMYKVSGDTYAKCT